MRAGWSPALFTAAGGLPLACWPCWVSGSSCCFIPFLFTLAISTTYAVILERNRQESRAREARQENLRTELSFLRSQVSPHFLFNVLNNIASLARFKSPELEPTIHKLSSLLQYMLYESVDEKVLLKTEVEYLRSYFELQQQRFGAQMVLKASIRLEEDWHSIEPMLLIPFLENAFKHGTGTFPDPEIDLELGCQNGVLDFSVRNKFQEGGASRDGSRGIGLANVKRRLELLYPGRHQLDITRDKGWFTVHLQIRFI
jgi:two-component system, LytTR family, sensor kinase